MIIFYRNAHRWLPWLTGAIAVVLVLFWMTGGTPKDEAPARPPTAVAPARTERPAPLTSPPRFEDYAEPDTWSQWVQGRDPPGAEGYRFRPLNERERRRIERHAPATDGAPRTAPLPRDWDYDPDRERGYGADPLTPSTGDDRWGSEGYSFRPLEPQGPGRERWQDPYGVPLRDRGLESAVPPSLRPVPQWGATPPEPLPQSHRMYPALDLPRDRRLSAR